VQNVSVNTKLTVMCWTLSAHSLTSCAISVVVLGSGFLRLFETTSGLSDS